MTLNEQVEQYAACIFEPDDVVELRTVDRNKRARGPFWKQARHLTALIPELQRLNHSGFNIFIAPNPRKAEGLSGDKNVLLCRCLFTDFDGFEPGDGCGIYEFVEPQIVALGLPLPTLAVFSGHGCHCYWRLDEPLPPDRWRPVQERLIATLGADPACANPERFLRLPGFLNHKLQPAAECFTMLATEVN